MNELVKLTRKYLGRLWSESSPGVFTREIQNHGIIKMSEILGVRVLDLRETNPPLTHKHQRRLANSFVKHGLIVNSLNDGGGGCEVYNYKCTSRVNFRRCRDKPYLRHGRCPSGICLRLADGALLEDMIRDATEKPAVINQNANQLLATVEG